MKAYRVFELGSLFGLLAPILVLAAPPPPVTALAYRPDGKQLALTRGTQSTDVILISNFL